MGGPHWKKWPVVKFIFVKNDTTQWLFLTKDKLLGLLYRISDPAPANPESSYFSEIQPSPAMAKFLTGFGRYQCVCSINNYG